MKGKKSFPFYYSDLKDLFFRFYEEYEYERRLKKRRAKLITATEEAFAHIKRMPGDHMKGESDLALVSFSH